MTTLVSNTELARADRITETLRDWIGSLRPRTIKGYQGSLAVFAQWTSIHCARTLTVAEALAWLCSLQHGEANRMGMNWKVWMQKDRKYAPTTIGTYIAALRSFVQAANVVDVVPWLLQVKAPKAEVTRDTRGPNPEGVTKLFSAAESQNRHKAARDVAILWLLFGLGLRRSELAALDMESVDGIEIKIVGKGHDAPEIFHLSSEIREKLDEWIAVRGKSPGPLFVNCDHARKGTGRLTDKGVYVIVKSLGNKAGVRVTPHGLRHSGTTQLLDMTNGNMREVRKWTRHRNVSTLLKYDDAREDIQGKLAQKLSDAQGKN